MDIVNLTNVLANDALTCKMNGGSSLDIPSGIVGLIHLIIVIIQIVVPILLIVWGMLDFAKGVIGGDEDKIKAGQKTFIQRVIAAIIVFLIVTIVQLIITAVGSIASDNDKKGANDGTNAWTCAKCVIQGQKTGDCKK